MAHVVVFQMKVKLEGPGHINYMLNGFVSRNAYAKCEKLNLFCFESYRQGLRFFLIYCKAINT